MKQVKQLLWVLGLALLSACTVGPDARRPEPPAIDQYTVKALPAKTVSSAFVFGVAQTFDPATPVRVDWWLTLGSPKLDQLIALALEKNPSLLAAQATLRQAQETYSARAGSTLYPQVGAGLADQRQQLSQIKCPIDFIMGDKDSGIPTAAYEKIKALNPKAHIHVIPHAKHAVYWTHSKELKKILDEILCPQ